MEPSQRQIAAGDRDLATGKFIAGNKAGTTSRKDIAKWRSLAMDATTESDMLEVWAELIRNAKAGEPWAIHEFLDRMMGKAQPAPPEAQQDVSALMARLWQEWGSPRPGAGPVEDAEFTARPAENGQPEVRP